MPRISSWLPRTLSLSRRHSSTPSTSSSPSKTTTPTATLPSLSRSTSKIQKHHISRPLFPSQSDEDSASLLSTSTSYAASTRSNSSASDGGVCESEDEYGYGYGYAEADEEREWIENDLDDLLALYSTSCPPTTFPSPSSSYSYSYSSYSSPPSSRKTSPRLHTIPEFQNELHITMTVPLRAPTLRDSLRVREEEVMNLGAQRRKYGRVGVLGRRVGSGVEEVRGGVEGLGRGMGEGYGRLI